MKKKTWLIALTAALATTLCLGFAGCQQGDPNDDGGGGKTDEFLNVYDGSGDFEISKWQAQSTSVYTEVTQGEDGSTFLRWVKAASQDTMTGVYAEVSGMVSSFGYLNITVSGTEGKTLMLRLGDSTSSSLLLGADKVVEVGGEAVTYSYEINTANNWMLDTVKEVYLIAEPGQNGASNVGTMTVHKTWFSETLPEGSIVTQSSPWKSGGNYNITQIGNTTSISYSGIVPNSWGNVYIDYTDHDPATQNTITFTLKNTGDTAVYLSIKTVEAANADDNSQLTWDNVILQAGESRDMNIAVSRQIRRILMFIASADNVPSGSDSGSFTVTQPTFSYTDPALQCVWQGTSFYTLEKGEGKGTFRYTALPNGEWNQNINTSVAHDPETQNTVRLTLTNRGEQAAYYFVKAQASDGSTEVAGDSFRLEPQEGKEVVLTLDSQVAILVIWVNADRFDGEAGETSAGAVEITNPVFSFEEPSEPPVDDPWNGSSVYQREMGKDGVLTVTFDGVQSNSWNNISRDLSVDPNHNTMTLTFTNTGDSLIYISVKTTDGAGGEGNQLSWNDVELSVGGTETAEISVNEQTASVVLFICSTNIIPENSYSGSFTVSDPVFSHKKTNPWTLGSSEYKSILGEDDVVTVTYAGVTNNSWRFLGRNIEGIAGTMSITFANTGDSVVYITLKAIGAGGYEAYSELELVVGGTETVSTLLTQAITGIELYICSTDKVPEGTYDGSFTMTEPTFNPWSGTDLYRTEVDGEGLLTVSYEGVTNGSWSNIGRAVSCDASCNTMAMTFVNTGDSVVYIQIKTVNAEGEGVTYTDIEIGVGETLPVTVSLPAAIARIELYICSTDTISEGTYNGSFTMTAPEFTVSES